MFDSGSQKSYMSPELADLLRATSKTIECIEIRGSGKQGAAVKGGVHDVIIESVNKKNPVFLEIYEVPTIATFQSVHAEITKSKYERLKELEFSDITDKDTLEIHILLVPIVCGSFRQEKSKREIKMNLLTEKERSIGLCLAE